MVTVNSGKDSAVKIALQNAQWGAEETYVSRKLENVSVKMAGGVRHARTNVWKTVQFVKKFQVIV